MKSSLIKPSLSVHIGEGILENVIAHAEAAFPEEACGLLLGRRTMQDAFVHCARPAQNISTNPMNRFEIDPQHVLNALRSNAKNGDELLGFYHAHPDGSFEPSPIDQKNAWAQMLYLIVGISRDSPPRIGSWHSTNTGAPFIRSVLTTQAATLTAV